MDLKYDIRRTCIFCDSQLQKELFDKDYYFPITQYVVDVSLNEQLVNIPHNVLICEKCNTPQNKYLGDLKEIYKINHADSTSNAMVGLHIEMLKLIKSRYSEIINIIEIGCSCGLLSDLVIEQFNSIDYYIIEPCFWGNRDKKIIIDDFYENVDDTLLNSNTLIISHVYEHFYHPKNILEKIWKNKNIENIILAFPNLEYCINNNIPHFLHSEHTYYIDNKFLEKYFDLYDFGLVEQKYYNEHSVIFFFKRKESLLQSNRLVTFKNENCPIDEFFNNIMNTIHFFNKKLDEHMGKDIYIWPASIHSTYLCQFGLNYSKLKGLLDNSKYKIGKKMHCINIPIFSFTELLLKNDKNTVVILNGGFNVKEVNEQIKAANNIIFISTN